MDHKKTYRFDTIAVHAGDLRPPIMRSVGLPIFQTSTYVYDSDDEKNAIMYHRMNNSPNHAYLGQKLAALEHSEAALVTSSGMSAITSAVLAAVGPGEHLLSQERLYGGTGYFFRDFGNYNRTVSFFSLDNLDLLPSMVTSKTKAIYIESLENPLLRAPDFERIVSFAKSRGLATIIDNTFPSPVNFNPIDLGFDIVVHSATKYLNGHSDIIAGAIMGTEEFISKANSVLIITGGCLDAHSCFLLQRGLKTLGIRVRQHNYNAMKFATGLGRIKGVERVVYPGLENHPDHELIRKYFSGFGGMLCFYLNLEPQEIDRRLHRMQLGYLAPSLGGTETLVTRPSSTSFANYSPAERKRLGLTDNLVRVSVGLEDPEDLLEDFMQALG
ncbi:MAG: PLP-dependent aspartate aminotransferase family protein [Oligoflexales bacterium]